MPVPRGEVITARTLRLIFKHVRWLVSGVSMTGAESVGEQARIPGARDGAVLGEAARSVREMLDRGDHRGITPAAMFALCRMLDAAAHDMAGVPTQRRRDLVRVAAQIRDRQASTPQYLSGQDDLL